MRAAVLTGQGGPPRVAEVAAPSVRAPEDVLVRVLTSSLNHADLDAVAQARDGVPGGLGLDFAGLVVEAGSAVADLAPGDGVLGFLPPGVPHEGPGAFAEYLVVPARLLARRPATLDFVQSGVLPLAGTAALLAVDAVVPPRRSRLVAPTRGPVLVVGGSGGVGTLAVQVANARGAAVVSTGQPQDRTLLHLLGAIEVLDYSGDWLPEVRERYAEGVDGLVDLVSDADRFVILSELVRPGGRVASTRGAADVSALARRGVTAVNVVARSDRELLGRLVDCADAGTLQPVIDRVINLSDLPSELGASPRPHGCGKVAVTIGD
ncbi:alcohol dehydrogenase catalytic domain-containing protein [Actinoalloteichus spitiensis]|uniref:alcohol dehydrogenase catalytic domain-containing protein n=1 Tax=Actinoalloteichus spitiensis TaxID=252394 RepID=UPI00036B4618|nr:zinc-binding dehydrogenase [Actinoalloteichus spitiensis]